MSYKKISYKVIHPKDTVDKVRLDALNKLAEDKIKSTPELTARKESVFSAITKETTG